MDSFCKKSNPGNQFLVGVAGIEPTAYPFGPRMSPRHPVKNLVGLPRIELGPYTPHAYTLPLCYSPTRFFTPMGKYYHYTIPRLKIDFIPSLQEQYTLSPFFVYSQRWQARSCGVMSNHSSPQGHSTTTQLHPDVEGIILKTSIFPKFCYSMPRQAKDSWWGRVTSL